MCLRRPSQLTLLEKALVDEHQYKTGKAALDAELKALLASHQASLEPNDRVRGMPIASIAQRGHHREDLGPATVARPRVRLHPSSFTANEKPWC